MKKILPLVFFIILLLTLVAGIGVVFKAVTTRAPKPVADSRVQLEEAKAKSSITKSYTFNLKDNKGKDVPFTYAIDGAELRNDIIVKGKKATAIAGRTFLIVNLKITNPAQQAMTINTNTYIRLSVNGTDDELMAPDIHNDPVVVQPISTKITRVGFPIFDTDKNLKLHIGEIAKEKDVLDISFQ